MPAAMRLKTRQLEGLGLALLTALSVIAYELWPKLDLAVSTLFFSQGRFEGSGWTRAVYHGTPLVGGLIVAIALLVVLVNRIARLRGRAPVVASKYERRSLMVLLVVVLGVGLLVHDGLKDHWGRARPMDVRAFGGGQAYTPPLQLTDQCERNCSFVSGHAAGGFALIAIGILGSRRTRWRWWALGMGAGGLVGLARMVEGRHFLGDVIFGGLLIWGLCLLLRQLWLHGRAYRLRRARAKNHPI